jgi:hypothetical protein
MSTTDQRHVPTAREAHRALVLGRVEAVCTYDQFTEAARDEALQRLTRRLTDGPWRGDRYERKRRRFRVPPAELGKTPTFSCDFAEMLVLRILGRTWPQLQFSVTPKGDVFAGDQNGYHPEISRLYVTTLSPVLDDAADLLLQTGSEGGRLYVHNRSIERASDRTMLARLDVTDWPVLGDVYY